MEDFSKINGPGTPLGDAQKVMTEILVEFDSVCRKNNLTYWIDYGTLLGAVRHGGFIPWDDDIDVSMPSDDFKRFRNIAVAELHKGFFMQDQVTDPEIDMGVGIVKVRKDNTLFINDYDDFKSHYHHGISIDVFEVVDYPNVSFRTWNFFRKMIFKSYGFYHYNPKLTFRNIICWFVFPVMYAFFKTIWNIMCAIRKPKRTLSRIERTPYGYPTLKTEILPLQEIQFEGHSFYAPKNPAARLEDNFGKDYMVIPPADKRRIHARFISTDMNGCHVNL